MKSFWLVHKTISVSVLGSFSSSLVFDEVRLACGNEKRDAVASGGFRDGQHATEFGSGNYDVRIVNVRPQENAH